MSNNSSPCMTCALRVTSLHSDAASDAHADAVFREFKRHHKPEAFRVHDLTGPKEENATWYCVIGDDHFNKDNVKCPNWIPDINGITPAEALKLHQNKPVPKKWFEKPSWQLILAACITVLGGLFVAYVVFELGWNSTKEAPSSPQKTAVEEKSAAISDASIPKKIPSNTLSQVNRSTISL